MTPQEEKQIQEWGSGLSDTLQLGLILTGDKRDSELKNFCEALSHIVPQIHIRKEKDESYKAPMIQLGETLRYQAVPLGSELSPFLEALDILKGKSVQVPAQIGEPLSQIDLPATLRVYVSSQCHFCPATVRQLIPLAFESKFIRIIIIDGMLFHEMAQADNILSVPTVLLDEHFRWTGEVQLEELIDIIRSRDPASLTASTMARMVTEGNAFALAEMMLEKGEIFPAFLDLLVHEHFSIRLGAMAAMEEVAGQSPELAATVADPLWERFQSLNNQIQGDILYIIGESGTSEMIPRLEAISDGDGDEELREAAQDAIESIRERASS